MLDQLQVTVRVPATSANLGPGFDCLGLALDLHSIFHVSVLPDQPKDTPPSITIRSTWGQDAAIAALPTDASNLMYQAFTAHLATLGLDVPAVAIVAEIGVPSGRGLGSSGMAIVAGLLAADAIAGRATAREDLLAEAIALERGHHADNVAAALFGGLVVVARDEAAGRWVSLQPPLPEQLQAVLFVPEFPMDTETGRSLLPTSYSRHDAVHNVGHAALMLAAIATGKLAVLGAAMDDRFHEPYRAQIYPQLPELLAAARGAGALGACLSGGGSTVLALATDHVAEIAGSLVRTAAALQIEGRVVITGIDAIGAQIIPATTTRRVISLACAADGASFDLRRTEYRCDCGRPLDVDLEQVLEPLTADAWRHRFDTRLGSRATVDRSGVWRFREALLPSTDIQPLARPEGQTTCYPVGCATSGGQRRIGEFTGVDQLWVKHEGENPTGSFKDRGMTVGVSVARWLGATAVACASTGNTSASMAAYAAQAGLPAIVLLPAGKVAAGKLAQAIAYGAEIRQIEGDFDQAMVDVERMCRDEGIYLLNSLNPFRILGQQSLAFEIAQQFNWDIPDWIVLPAGNLGNTSALGMGLLRAHRLGLIARLPRIAAIQAAGANPFYASFITNFEQFQPVHAQTIATAINIGNPVSFLRARTVIQATQGVVAQVTDDEILQAKAVIDRSGIGCEPASAASVAGVRQLVASGVIRPTDRVVAVLTGNLLKDPDSIMLAQKAAVREPTLAEVG